MGECGRGCQSISKMPIYTFSSGSSHELFMKLQCHTIIIYILEKPRQIHAVRL